MRESSIKYLGNRVPDVVRLFVITIVLLFAAVMLVLFKYWREASRVSAFYDLTTVLLDASDGRCTIDYQRKAFDQIDLSYIDPNTVDLVRLFESPFRFQFKTIVVPNSFTDDEKQVLESLHDFANWVIGTDVSDEGK
jgi:hypothetical protein